MRIRLAALLLAGATSAATAHCAAQGAAGTTPRAGRRAQVRMLNPVSIPATALDTLVKLTDDQKAKLAAIREKLAADEKALRPPRGTQADPETVRKRAEVRRQAQTEGAALLTAEQKAELRAAARWAGPLNRAGVPWTLYADLKLTDKQKADLTAIGAEIQSRQRALPRGQSAVERKEALKPLNADVRARVAALLTAEQSAALEQARKTSRGARGKRSATDPKP